MYKQKKILAVILARSGSKGIRNKNVHQTVDGTYFASDYGKRRGMIRDWFESCFPSTPIPPYPHFKVENKMSFGTGEINSTDYPAEGAGQNIRQH